MNDHLQTTEKTLYQAHCWLEKFFTTDHEAVCVVTEEHLILIPSLKIDISSIVKLDLQPGSPLSSYSSAINRFDSLEIKYSNLTSKLQKVSLKMASPDAYSIRQILSHQILLKSRDWVDWNSPDDVEYLDDKNSKLNQTALELQVLGVENRIPRLDSPVKNILATEYRDHPELIFIRNSPICWIYLHSEDFSWGSFLILGWTALALYAIDEMTNVNCLDIGIPFARPILSDKPIEVYLSGIRWMGNDSETGLLSLLNNDENLKSSLLEFYRADNSKLHLVIHLLDKYAFWTITLGEQKTFNRPLWSALERIATYLNEFSL